MSIHITILGLGKIGASVGMALGKHSDQVECNGFDPQIQVAQQARKINAVSRTDMDLVEAVKGADVILLALPLDDVLDVLKAIASHIREEIVILDTSPAKMAVAAWVKEFLPARSHYVGISCMLNPRYLDDPRETIDAANANLFENSPLAIAVPAGTAGGALNLAADMARLLGAQPFFCDLAEMDGLTASTQLLPQLVSTALLNATLDQSGWTDARKFAGAFFASASSAISSREESLSLREEALLNKTNLLRSLDGYQAALQALRSDIENDRADQLEQRLEHARMGRSKWVTGLQKPGWQADAGTQPEMPKPGDFLKQQFGFFSRLSGKNPTKPEKKD
jgi:prephenate dehydrogenase